MIETAFAHAAQTLLWPVMVLLALAFLYALWAGGAALMEAWLRWRQPAFAALPVAPDMPLEELELWASRRLTARGIPASAAARLVAPCAK